MRRDVIAAVLASSFLLGVPENGLSETKRVPLSGKVVALRTHGGLAKVLVKSTGNVTHPFTLVIRGPEGISSRTLVEGPSGRIWEASLRPTSELQKECAPVKPEEVEELKAPIPPPNNDSTSTPHWSMPPNFDQKKCSKYSQNTLDQTRPLLEQGFKRPFTDLETCAYLDSNGVREEHFQQNFGDKGKMRSLSSRKKLKVIRVSGILHKDSCSGNDKDEYTLRILLSLPKGTPDQKISVQVRAKTISGRPATIKPVSDGKFAPQPLILMQWLSSACGATISAVRWADGRPISEATLPVEDYIPYRTLTLARAPIGSVLKGGKGTFSLTNTVRGYGACFDFIATRQRKNGYPE